MMGIEILRDPKTLHRVQLNLLRSAVRSLKREATAAEDAITAMTGVDFEMKNKMKEVPGEAMVALLEVDHMAEAAMLKLDNEGTVAGIEIDDLELAKSIERKMREIVDGLFKAVDDHFKSIREAL